MSDLMKQFLTAYIAWVESGAPVAGDYGLKSKNFSRDYGLCSNLYFWSNQANLGDWYYNRVGMELQDMLKYDGLSQSYPFNEDMIHYIQEGTKHKAHTNEKRLAWVRNKLGIVDAES
jgi:hypothetical protein